MHWKPEHTRKAEKLSEQAWRERKKKEAEMDNERTRADWAVKHAQDYAFWLGRVEAEKALGYGAEDYAEYAARSFMSLSNMVLSIQEAKAGKDIAFMVSARAVEEISDELRNTHGITGDIEEIIALVARHMYTRSIVPTPRKEVTCTS